VFLGRDPRIANRLSITVPYFNFYWFWKISHFCPKSMGVSLRSYRKLLVWGKNWSKLYISWSWPPYCESVIYNGPVFQFLLVLKNFTFFSKSGFTKNGQFGAKTDQNSLFLCRNPRIANRLSIKVSYFNFYGFWKISHFCSKSKGVSLRFYQKFPVWGKTDWNSVFLGHDPRIANRLSITVPYFNFYRFWKISHFCSKSKGVSLR
jgi:hypothetical protein